MTVACKSAEEALGGPWAKDLLEIYLKKHRHTHTHKLADHVQCERRLEPQTSWINGRDDIG